MLDGNGGFDSVDGGAGDDTLVWRDGDGDELLVAGPGSDTLEVDGSATQGDAFRFSATNGQELFERTNLDPVSLEFPKPGDPGPETVVVNGQGGDDSLTVGPGLRTAVIADGGAGDDTLSGSDEVDTFTGGSGEDTLDPGPGTDSVDGGDGNDALLTRARRPRAGRGWRRRRPHRRDHARRRRGGRAAAPIAALTAGSARRCRRPRRRCRARS